jgi:hypothetical protein
LALTAVLNAQIPDAGDSKPMLRECGTALRPEDVPAIQRLAAAGAYAAAPRQRGAEPWVVPLTFHVVRMSNGSGGLAEANLVRAMEDANAFYAPAGIHLVRPLPTQFIDNDNFYLNIDTQAEIDALKSTNVVCGTINVYFTQNLATESGGLCGQSSFTWNAVQGIVMNNDCTGTSGNSNSTFAHEVGHYFDLLHTHETANGAECVDGSNCSVAGDLICDTPADPTLSSDNMTDDCQYIGTTMDSCNNQLYAPQTWNLMSYARPRSCRTAFTSGQNAVAAFILEHERLEEWAPSVCSCGMLVWVDVNADIGQLQFGTQLRPFDDIDEGLNAVCQGGMVMLRTGVYQTVFPLTMTQAVTLNAAGGLVRISP